MRKVISTALVLMMLVSVFSINIRAGKAEAVKGWQEDAKTIGVALTEPEEFSILGHWMANDQFVKATDWYENGEAVYMQRIAPVDDEGTMQVFNENDHIVFNYDLYKSFDAEEASVMYLDENVEVAAYLFGAQKTDAETGEFTLLNEYRGYDSSVSGVVEVPYDNFVAAFVFVVENADLQEFGAFVTITDAGCGFMPTLGTEKADMTGFAVDLTADGLEASILPRYDRYAIANAMAFTMELTGGEYYTAKLSTKDMTGFSAYFTDENGDVINQVFASGIEGDTEAELSIYPMIEGEYYLVIAGYNLDNRGTVDVAFEKVDTTEEITEIDVSEAENDLYLDYGIYEVTGENNNIKLVIGDAADVVLDHVTIGGILLSNYGASAVIESKGVNFVNAQADGYGITNVEAATAGVYFVGDAIKVSSTVETKGAILVHDAPVHINMKKFMVKADAVEGYYPVGIWVIGKNLPTLTLAEGMKLNKHNVVATMMYSEYFAYGYTIANDAVINMNSEPDFTTAALDFAIYTDLLGDVNLDGEVDTVDVTEVLKYCADMVELTEDQMIIGDVNYDLTVNTADAVILLRYFAQIITEF